MDQNYWTEMSETYLPLIILFAIWLMTLKGLALYRAGSLRQKGWFVTLLVLNTAGILELIYLLAVSRNKK